MAASMTTPVNAACQRCRGSIVVDFVRLGSAMRCPHCAHETIAEVPIGGVIPLSGYQLNFNDFQQLLEPGESRAAVEPLLMRWFGSVVRTLNDRPSAVGADGVPIDLLWLHLQIQNDPARQHELYQIAMSLWR